MNISSEKLRQIIYEMAANDSHEALKSLYLAYYSRLLNLAVYYVKSEQTAEEIVSDTFQAVWEQRSKLPEIHNFNAYLYKMVRNISINYLRKNVARMEDIERVGFRSSSSAGETPESSLISAELMERLDQAIESLPDRCRLVFKLVREDNLRYKEVALMLNISVKTIEAHMSLAIRRLREEIRKIM